MKLRMENSGRKTSYRKHMPDETVRRAHGIHATEGDRAETLR